MPNLSVMENLFLCHEHGFSRGGFLSRRAMKEKARGVLEQVNVHLDVDALAGDVSPSSRQMIEIARLLWLSTLYGRENPVLILDEPTTVLTDSERETLFSTLKKLKENASVILISHRLQEIVDNADRIVVLRDGRTVTEMPSSEARIADIERLMVGHAISEDRFWESDRAVPGDETVLEVRELGRRGQFEPISFSVRDGGDRQPRRSGGIGQGGDLPVHHRAGQAGYRQDGDHGQAAARRLPGHRGPPGGGAYPHRQAKRGAGDHDERGGERQPSRPESAAIRRAS